MEVTVGRNRIKFEEIEWFKMWSIHDDRIVGKKGNYYFANYDKFDPKKATHEYLEKFKFKPLNPKSITLIPIS